MNIDAFLQRIGYQGSLEISLPVLATLQRQFLLSVPFENLDIHRNIKLRFDQQSVFEKIVQRHCGGVCYESNALFYDALVTLGFQVDILAAEMCSDQPLKAFYDHMTLRVRKRQRLYY